MADVKIQYGLRHKESGEILGHSTASNDGMDFCGDVSVSLTRYSDDGYWLVDTIENAEYVRHNSTEWYNAGFSTPNHDYEPDELEIIRVKTIISEEPISFKIPTFEEYAEEKYADSDPRHLDYIKRCIAEGQDVHYSLYDLQELLRKRGQNADNKD
jgi:hypothetical protein